MKKKVFAKRVAGSSVAAALAVMLAVQAGALASGTFGTEQPALGLPQTESLRTAEQVAATWVRNAHVGGAVQVSIAATSFATAQAVIQGKSPTEAESGGAPTIAALRAEPVYLMVLTAPAGARFEPPEPIPAGTNGPMGTVADLLVSVNTSQVLGEALWSAAPSLAQLGPVTETAIAPAAIAAGPPKGAFGVVEGNVYQGSRAKPGWHVLIGKPHTNLLKHATRESRTYVKGFFSFTLSPGAYQVGVKAPNGKLCASRTITASAGAERKLTLRCH